MFKIGVSIFNGLKEYTLDENLEYLRYAKQLGYDVVFSSAHINEASSAYDDLQKCIDETYNLGMKLSLDISKPTFEKMPTLDKLYSIRLDYGFSLDDIIELSNTANFFIELNASTISEDKFLELINKGLNVNKIRMSFNYYPKLYTGHDISFCKEKVDFFHKYGISVGAFIPSKKGFRPPLYEGLPTVEEHRYISLHKAIEELKAINVDEIMFGDAYASKEELNILKDHHHDLLEVEFIPSKDLPSEYNYIYEKEYVRRIDSNLTMLRVSSRNSNQVIEPFNTKNREIFDVTIDNKGFLRYQGEIDIILKEINKDERVNVIGKINTTDIIIDSIKKGRKFKFRRG